MQHIFFIVCCLITSLGVYGQNEGIVQTKYGPVSGKLTDIARSFLGIPYMAPPVGDLRWTPPQPARPWGPSVLPATEFKPGCPQICQLPPHTCPDTISEDCLYLNVYTPRMAKITQPLPVMVWIPGGHFEQGTAGCVLYEASTIVGKGDVIVVTINYRLGFLGWLTTDNLPGNYGLLDQIFALQWLQENIAAFGGDPNKVTLFGQSAGATSIRAHLISPASKGLFHKAILQSDPLSIPMRHTSDASSFGNSFCQQLGCCDVPCMRSKNITDILVAQKVTSTKLNYGRPIETFLPFVPTIDGKIVPSHFFDALHKGTFNEVPIIIGDVSQDALLFVYKAINFSLNLAEYELIVSFIFETDSLDVSEEYPPYPIFGDKRPQLGVAGTDYIFECPARHMIDLIQKINNQLPLYIYQFEHTIPSSLWGPTLYYCDGKVCHGAELAYEFASPLISPFLNFTADEKVMSDSIIGYWTNFAHSGDPNVGPHAPSLVWPKWNNSTLQNMHFATPQNTVQTGLLKEFCDFWDKLGYHHGW